jgi:hypothetical protein
VDKARFDIRHVFNCLLLPTTIGEQSRKGGGSENFFHATVIVHLREKK